MYFSHLLFSSGMYIHGWVLISQTYLRPFWLGRFKPFLIPYLQPAVESNLFYLNASGFQFYLRLLKFSYIWRKSTRGASSCDSPSRRVELSPPTSRGRDPNNLSWSSPDCFRLMYSHFFPNTSCDFFRANRCGIQSDANLFCSWKKGKCSYFASLAVQIGKVGGSEYM